MDKNEYLKGYSDAIDQVTRIIERRIDNNGTIDQVLSCINEITLIAHQFQHYMKTREELWANQKVLEDLLGSETIHIVAFKGGE